MKRIGLAVLCLGLAGGAHAGMTAGELALTCAKGEMQRSGQLAAGWESSACSLVFSGYRDGLIEGSLRGAMGVYIHDRGAAATVKGGDDIKTRIVPVLAQSRCNVVATGGASVEALKRAFASYVGEHPDVSNRDYQPVLSEAINAKLCQR
ncbi:hypothetical protein [Achromobacter xylosoxidans]|uniref:hypothetical protein n=1 Tax=Alcaligenes xylosoxydans xylosoxydans TaxID=85698 RepID=UPI000B49000C|nr:hypothetical protein [Achromobacter xylosoxidans]